MSEEQNKAIVRRFVEEIFNRGNMSAADEFMAPDFVEHEELPLEYRMIVRGSNS